MRRAKRYPVLIACILSLGCTADRPAADTPVYLTRPTPEVKALRLRADSLRSTDLAGSMALYSAMLRKAEELRDDQGLVEAYRRLVFVAGVQLSQTDTALRYSDEALRFAHRLGDANTLCDVYGLRAVTYQVAGMLDSATAANKEALRYMDLDTAPDSLRNWPLYLNVAGMFNELNDQRLAIAYTHRYLDGYALPNKDTNRMELAYNNLGLYHLRLRDSV